MKCVKCYLVGIENRTAKSCPVFGKSYLIGAKPAPAGFLHGMTCLETLRDVDDPLISAPAEIELQTPLCKHERSVNEHIQLSKKRLLGVGTVSQLLKGIAGIGGNLIALLLQQLCKYGKARCLGKGFAAGEGDPMA